MTPKRAVVLLGAMLRFDCCGGVGGFHNSYCQHYDDEITALAFDYLASRDKIEAAVGPAFRDLAKSIRCRHDPTEPHLCPYTAELGGKRLCACCESYEGDCSLCEIVYGP